MKVAFRIECPICHWGNKWRDDYVNMGWIGIVCSHCQEKFYTKVKISGLNVETAKEPPELPVADMPNANDSLLEWIESYDVAAKGVEDLIQAIISNWNYHEYCPYKDGLLELHTVGWSENEEIVSALQKNLLFFPMFWEKTERGGHYYFKIKIQIVCKSLSPTQSQDEIL